MTLHQAGRINDAEKIYQQIMAAQPNQADALQLLGVIASQRGEWDLAVDYLGRACAITPHHPAALFNYGLALKEKGDIDQALTQFRKLIRLKPDFAEAHHQQGLLLQQSGHLERGEAALRQAIRLKPNFPQAHHDLGNILQNRQALPAAIASYREALRLNPSFPEAHYNLANALKSQGKLAEAKGCYQQAIRLKPDLLPAHNNLGTLLMEQGELAQAVNCYRKALQLKPDFSQAHNNLGNALKSLGELDEAVWHYQQAITFNPTFAEAHRHLTHTRKTDPHSTHLAQMEKLLADSNLPDTDRIHLHFALGKAKSDLQRTREGFQHFLTGNRLQRARTPFDLNQERAFFQAIQERFDPAFFTARADWGVPDPTPIFILGMPRSGTSLVEQILASHPDLHGAGELTILEESLLAHPGIHSLHQLPKKIATLKQADLETMGQNYLSHLRQRHPGRIPFISDKMPGNFRFIGLIKIMLPHAKVIHIQRSPVDTCFSIFRNYFAQGHDYSWDLTELGGYHRLYQGLMSHWKTVLSDFVYDLCYEELVGNQEGETRRLLDYCGLDWHTRCLAFHETHRSVLTTSNVQVRKPLYASSVGTGKAFQEELTPLLAALAGKNGPNH
ncbi:MAG: tetratricopeptide repeat protein [Magnetococcales bacterium]|nr:tetratricopeptide repeat protein [Magnetococcales bacterium]